MIAETLTPLEEIYKLSDELPELVLLDIFSRVQDWVATGGKVTDEYIVQQLRYAERVVYSVRRSRGVS